VVALTAAGVPHTGAAAVSLLAATAASIGGGSVAKPGMIWGTWGSSALRPADCAKERVMMPIAEGLSMLVTALLPLNEGRCGSAGSTGISLSPNSPFFAVPALVELLEVDLDRPAAARAVELAAAAADEAPVAIDADAACTSPSMLLAREPESELLNTPNASVDEAAFDAPLVVVAFVDDDASEVS